MRKLLFALLIISNVCTASTAKTPAPEKQGSPVVAFDLAHQEIFTPFRERRLNYAIFHHLFEREGYKTTLNEQPFTPKNLKNVDTLVLFGAMRPLMASEITAVTQFVRRGGNLLILLHISRPLANLTRQFDVFVSNYIILDEIKKIIVPGDFNVPQLEKHPLNNGVKSLAVYGSWAVLTRAKARTVAFTSPQAWMDENGNKQKDSFEKAGKYGIVAVNENFGGKVIVIADDAPLLNDFIKNADNMAFARNLVRWFKGDLN